MTRVADDEQEHAHPLFPIEDGAPSWKREIGWIYVYRQEGSIQKSAPRPFGADELTSEEQIADLYGGGAYELVARDPDRARIVTRRRLTLDGRSRPMVEAQQEDDRDVGLMAARVATAAAAPAGIGLQQFLGLATTVLPTVMTFLQAREEREQRRYEAQMSREDARQREFITLMTSQATNGTQSSNAMVGQLLSLALARPGGQGEISAFMKGLEVARDQLPRGGDEGDDTDSLFESINQALETFSHFKDATGAPNPFVPPDSPTVSASQEEDEPDDEG